MLMVQETTVNTPSMTAGSPSIGMDCLPSRKTGPASTGACVAALAVMLFPGLCPAALAVSEQPPFGAFAQNSPRPFPTMPAEGPVTVAQASEMAVGTGPLNPSPDPGTSRREDLNEVEASTTRDAGMDDGAPLAALEAATLRLEGEIAELGRLADWQARLLSAARTDPDGARRQRRTRTACLETQLAPFCERLNGMYRDDDAPSGSPDASPSGPPDASPSGPPDASPSGPPDASPSGPPDASPSGPPDASVRRP